MGRDNTTRLSSFIRDSIGLPAKVGRSIGSKSTSRKELRQLERKLKKQKKASRKPVKQEKEQVIGTNDGGHKHTKNLNAAPRPSSSNNLTNQQLLHQKNKAPKEKQVVNFIDPEDVEITRLEKLLGVDKSRKTAAEKLNKEYEMYEGIGGGLGDFLMELDDLVDSVKTGKQVSSSRGTEEHLVEEGEWSGSPHILDEDQQEESDVSLDGAEEEEDYEEDGNEEDSDEEDGGRGDDNDDDYDDNDGGTSDVEEEADDEDNSDLEDTSAHSALQSSDSHVYRPVAGEDIYGRVRDPSSGAAKYVPPNRRLANSVIKAAADENSETVVTIKRLVNGQLNRLSDEKKDTVVRALKGIFDANSITLCSEIFKGCLLSVCANQTQLMTTLIPLYAALVAALHFAIGIDIGAYIVESLATTLHKAVSDPDLAQDDAHHRLISDKTSSNILLLLVYMYNFRVLHHGLIMDILSLLVQVPLEEPWNSTSITTQVEKRIPWPERDVELILGIFEHCGLQLRSDDPVGLKSIVTAISRRCHTLGPDSGASENSRVRFMVEAMTDLKNNKSRRTQSAHADTVKTLRKWLGSVKSSIGCKSGDLCLRVSLQDLLDAENRGRWWRAGAKWLGRDSSSADNSNTANEEKINSISTNLPTNEERQLLVLATKLRMNTSIRKSIFMVVMSSRDVDDAFERIQRLQLKGKQDREIVRVVVECCSQEKAYNPFYAELLSLFCEFNRQFKTTIQFVFWDNFRILEEETDKKFNDRRVVNQARLLAHLICRFHVSLSVLKPIDMSNPNADLLLFLATFFMALFSFKIPEEEFQKVIDRVATTADYATVRDNLLIFLQQHLAKIPNGLNEEDTIMIRKRRKFTVHTLETMNVLDMVRSDDS